MFGERADLGHVAEVASIEAVMTERTVGGHSGCQGAVSGIA